MSAKREKAREKFELRIINTPLAFFKRWQARRLRSSQRNRMSEKRKDSKEFKFSEHIEENEPAKKNYSEKPDILWFAACGIITVLATVLRFVQLEARALHHDEGVNGFFLTTLFREGVYKYDPANYHGPDLYYLALAVTKVFGLNTISIRGSVAVFGVLIVVLTFFLKDYIGKFGSLFAALFLALSPGMVYISRYFIHEILFVFFSYTLVLAILFFIERRKAGIFAIGWMTIVLLICFVPSVINLANMLGGSSQTAVWAFQAGFFLLEIVLIIFVMRMLISWDDGRPIYLLLASVSAVLLFATKETAFITLGTMIIACFCVFIWRKIYGGMVGGFGENEYEPVPLIWSNFRKQLGDNLNIILLSIAVAAIFIYLGILFFSSFFTYPEGVKKAFEAYALWTKTGSKDHTQNGMWAYVKWLWEIESPIVILSAIGCLIALAKARHRFAVFTAFWAFGLFLAYTIIPYKTPWLAVSFLLPMCIIAGYGIGEFLRVADLNQRVIGGVLALAATVVLGYQTYQLNFVRYDDEALPYIYAHTKRGFLDMIDQIHYYADKSGKGNEATVEVVSPDYWSMPWYLKDYKNAHFFGQLTDVNAAEMIVAKKTDQDAAIRERYAARYKIAGEYPLRPGVDLYLLVRNDLAEDEARKIGANDDDGIIPSEMPENVR